MFTGIVSQTLKLKRKEAFEDFQRFHFEFPTDLLEKLEIGASVAFNGTCLTVTDICDCVVSFDVIKPTLAVTNLGALTEGGEVNVERSFTFGQEVGGHILSGHIHDTAKVHVMERTERNCSITFTLDPKHMKYIFEKGYIAINGCSITLATVDKEACSFTVGLIPETLERTNLGVLQLEDAVNIELDSQTITIVDTVERVMAERK